MTALTLTPAPITTVNGHTRPAPGKPAAEGNAVAPDLGGAWVAMTIVIGIMAALIALGGMVSSFRAVSVEMEPTFGAKWAWIVPLVDDLTVFVFSGVDLVLARLDMGHPLARWTVYGATGGTVYLNYMAGGNAAGRVAHVLMPSIWVVFVELMRHVVRRQTNLVTGSHREPIPFARWLLSPVPTFLLFRRMVLWGVNSYTVALDREARRLDALSVVREYTGKQKPGEVSPLVRRRIALGELDADEVRALLAAKPAGAATAPGELPSTEVVYEEPPKIDAVREPRVSNAQYKALLWVSQNTVILGADGGCRSVTGAPLRGEYPSTRTLQSLQERGWVASTPGRPIGLTIVGVAVLGSWTGGTDCVVHYRPVEELTRGMVVELWEADGSLRHGWVSNVSQLGPAETMVHVGVQDGGVEARALPLGYCVRVLGRVDRDRQPVLWL